MLILPAIDIRAGRCVRLRQGNYDQEMRFDDDPVAVASRWVRQGASYLHLVDLDGAQQGRPVNDSVIRRIVQTAGVPCQLGGGLRSDAAIDQALSWGLQRVVVGTRAISEPGWLESISSRFPGRIVLGIDARDGQAALQGWQQISMRSAQEVARQAAGLPLAALVYTDISRDGMLSGPNLPALQELGALVRTPLIASGGITTLDDVRQLASLDLAGCIIGRALYEGNLNLADAIRISAL